MKYAKRLVALVCLFTFLALALASCQLSKSSVTTVRVGGMKGPTSIGMAKLMADSQNKKTDLPYEFTIAASATELTPLLIQGKLDIAAVPANLAAVLHAQTEGEIMVLAINTLGVQYFVKRGDVTLESVTDLKGKTIYATGKGTVNEYNLRYLLTQNGLDPDADVTVEWKSEPTEVVAILKMTDNAVAMLPQPYVTIAQSNVEGLSVALSMEEEWNKVVTNGSRMITGVLVVRRDFAENNKALLKAFLREYEASTQYVNAHPDEAGTWVETFIGVKAPIATKAIPHCNITCITEGDMKGALAPYLAVLFEQNPKAIGGAMPADDFYYSASN